MRTFMVFAIIGLYITVAFVPPSAKNLEAAMIQLGSAKVFDGLDVGAARKPGQPFDLVAAAQTLSELASRVTAAQNAKLSPANAKEYAQTLTDAAGVLSSVAAKTPAELQVDMRNEIAKQAAEAIQNIGKGKPAGSTAWKKLLRDESDPVVAEQLHLIQDAITAGDVRRCGELPYASSVERTVDGAPAMTPSHGDYLAYCLARLTGESGRCEQIDAKVLPDLRSACGADFGTDV